MTRLRAMLVDDEPLALARLARTLAPLDKVDVVGVTSKASEAMAMIAALRPDILFLDIAMPGLTGFDLVARLPGRDRPAIIFVTAFDSHAVRAFGVDAADYLMKPVVPDRLAQAVDRAIYWLNGRARQSATSDDHPDTPIESLWAHRHRETVRIRVDEIEWIEAQGDYVRLHTNDGRGGLVRMTLSALEVQLDTATFIRVHRSAICRRSAISGLRRKATGALAAFLASGGEAPVGRKFSGGLRTLLKRLDA
ncbi:LytR/AlgR family response regulator transcription factor [Sphingomonas alpina]|uniref:Response regulator transcription factor n=1 Tax=Sphingomonas alpina TaxID=653931 RepID=A0A7H0LF54_9SPHN|nr:LytTR family DNA-binding domain-containing protein [Sphingomonas alpina]QNQ08307.1 response regulator transcription factor [Sphingomonas alpina]